MPILHSQERTDEVGRFLRLQADHFAHADTAKFLWQTTNPYLARTERELLGQVPLRPTERLLEVGCGEGGNLQLIGLGRNKAIGLDFSRQKVAWASRQIRQASFVCGDATRLPFRDEYFDVVLCRDVLHHVADKGAVVREIFRVCRSEGRIVVIEPNGKSPIMWLLGWAIPAERDLIGNSSGRLVALFDLACMTDPEIIRTQPLPFGRLLFHYRWGFPRLSRWLGELVLKVEGMARWVLPSERWAYMIFRTTKRGTISQKEGSKPEVLSL